MGDAATHDGHAPGGRMLSHHRMIAAIAAGKLCATQFASDNDS
jgi:hypothetical protein